jgi:hypothetical protein
VRLGWVLSVSAALALSASCTVDDLPSGGGASGSGGAAGAGTSGSSGGGVAGAGQAGASIGGQAGQAGVAGDAGEGGPPCTTLHVSPAGNDTSSGCAPGEPKKTIGAALDRARASKDVSTILVCAGSYDQELVLDLPIQLLGGHDCSSFSRTADYGHPVFDGVNKTTIGGQTLPAALRITGTAIGPSTLVDGFTVRGASGADQSDGAAMKIDSGAAPVVSNCEIIGGSTISVTGPGSVGLAIESGAKPEIRANQIDGGTGSTYASESVGRAGIHVDGATPYLHDNAVTGGAAAPKPSYGIGSAALVLRDAGPLTEAAGRPVWRNTFHGGDAIGQEDGVASAGVLLLGGTEVDLVENSIRPGRSLGKAVQLRGVESRSSGALRISQCRIFGGDPNSADPSQGFRVGAMINGAESALIENSMIYGGVPIDGYSGPSPSFAVALANVTGATLRHNTLYSGPSGFPTVGTVLHANHGVTGTVVQNNLMANAAGWSEPFYIEPCASFGTFERVQNNLLFNLGKPVPNVMAQVYGYGPSPLGSCYGWQSFANLDDLSSHFLTNCSPTTPGPCTSFGGTKVDGNRVLRSECDGESGCIPWQACDAAALPCLQSVIEGWSTSDNGLSTLFGPGWKLAADLPCAVTQSSLDLSVPFDLFGTPRTTPASMGAHEQDGPCLP